MDSFKPRLVAVTMAVGQFACGEDDSSTTVAMSTPTSVSASDPSSATGSSTSGELTGTAETGATSTTGEPTTDEPTTDEPTTGGPTTGSEPGDGHAAKIQPIWDANCLTGCHGPGGQGAPWGNLTSGSAYDALVGVDAIEAAGMKRVQPGDRNASYLWHKLNGTQASVGGSGTQMPAPPQAALSNDEMAIIGAWIDAGAPP